MVGLKGTRRSSVCVSLSVSPIYSICSRPYCHPNGYARSPAGTVNMGGKKGQGQRSERKYVTTPNCLLFPSPLVLSLPLPPFIHTLMIVPFHSYPFIDTLRHLTTTHSYRQLTKANWCDLWSF